MPCSSKRRACEEYVRRASRRGIHPLIVAVAFALVALVVMTMPLWWESGRRPAGIVMEEVDGLRLEAAKHEEAARFDEAGAAVDRAVELLEREGLAEAQARVVAELKAQRKQLAGKREAAARLAAAWAACAAERGQAVEAAALTALIGRITTLLEAANGSPLRWVAEAETSRRELQARLVEAQGREAKRDWAVFRAAVTAEYDLDGESARFGPAVRKIRAEFLPTAAPMPRKAAEDEIARLESRARAELAKIAKRAEKRPGSVGFIESTRPRFDGCAVEAELEALVRSFGN
jgi:hypothetical protein